MDTVKSKTLAAYGCFVAFEGRKMMFELGVTIFNGGAFVG
jgi:hypothetical protein